MNMIILFIAVVSFGPVQDTPAETPGPTITALRQYEATKVDAIFSAAFNADGSRVAMVPRGGLVRVWETEGGFLRAFLNPPPDDRALANDVAFDPTGRNLVVAGAWYRTYQGGHSPAHRGGLIRIWNVKNGEEVFRFAGAQIFKKARISADQKTLIALTTNGNVVVKHLLKTGAAEFEPTAVITPELPKAEKDRRVERSHISISGDHAAAFLLGYKSSDHLLIYDIKARTTREIEGVELEPFSELVITDDDKHVLLVGDRTNTVIVYDVEARAVRERVKIAAGARFEGDYKMKENLILRRPDAVFGVDFREKTLRALPDFPSGRILATRSLGDDVLVLLERPLPEPAATGESGVGPSLVKVPLRPNP